MPDRNITDYPEIFVDGKCFHIRLNLMKTLCGGNQKDHISIPI